MKKSALILVVLLASLILAACGGGGPKAVVEDAFKALEKGDMDKVNELACGENIGFENISSEDFTIELSDMKYEEISNENDRAEVKVTGKMKLEVAGETMEQDLNDTVVLEKKDGKWCLTNE